MTCCEEQETETTLKSVCSTTFRDDDSNGSVEETDLIVKLKPGDPFERTLLQLTNGTQKESEFYTKVMPWVVDRLNNSPENSCNIPHIKGIIFGFEIDVSLILEDLSSDYKNLCRIEGFDKDHLSQTFTVLGRLHGCLNIYEQEQNP